MTWKKSQHTRNSFHAYLHWSHLNENSTQILMYGAYLLNIYCDLYQSSLHKSCNYNHKKHDSSFVWVSNRHVMGIIFFNYPIHGFMTSLYLFAHVSSLFIYDKSIYTYEYSVLNECSMNKCAFLSHDSSCIVLYQVKSKIKSISHSLVYEYR